VLAVSIPNKINVAAYLLATQGIEPEIRTYNTVIIACNMSGQAQEALKVYERMLTAGALPTATTYTALISAYGKNGQLDRALQIFEDMVGLTALLQAASLLLSCMLGLIVLAD
jgi:pentatricopeptide repeat protein